MRYITVYFRNGYALVESGCHIPGLGQTYTCHHVTVSHSSLRRILSLYPKYKVNVQATGTAIAIQIYGTVRKYIDLQSMGGRRN